LRSADSGLARLFAGLFGAFLGLCLLKFGNPPIMEKYISPPGNAYEFVLSGPWPIGWAYGMLVVLAVLGLFVARWRTPAPGWLLTLPLVWLGWQVLAVSWSVDAGLSQGVVKHFIACVACFYLGLFALGPVRRSGAFWAGLVTAFLLLLAVGWDQHFGGLTRSRDYFMTYVYPTLPEVPPEYLKKLNSTRIFATLFYPNSLAGALLLLLPAVLTFVWQASGNGRFTPGARGLLVGLPAVGGVACLYWSGSKGGWLIMLGQAVVVLLLTPMGRRMKLGIVATLVAIGLAGFFWKYAAFFDKGATSVSARLDYWHAAAATAVDRPVWGSGPGTFARVYQELKRPESEMARLVHNDYLEQASDSGLPGFLTYAAFVVGAVGLSYRNWRRRRLARQAGQGGGTRDLALELAVWLGVLGWTLQGLIEFGLYLPALAWPAFAFLGWLLAKPAIAMDKPPAHA
jgi:O-antigen ligase